MSSVLNAAGGDLDNLVDITVFLTNMDDYAGCNETYNQYFTVDKGPARTTVAVSKLPGKHLIIEIKGTACLQQPCHQQ